MRVWRLIVVLAVSTLLMAACSKSGSNTNAPGNTNASRPANSNRAAATNTAAGAKKTVTPVSTAPSGENIYTHEEGGIQFEAPPTWIAEGEDDTIRVTAPDNSVSVVFTVVEQANLENVAGAIDAELETVMDNVEAKEEIDEGTHEGMKVFSTEGTGQVSGAPIQWATALIMAKKPVLIYAFAAPGQWEKHEADVAKFIRSVKPVK